MDNNKEYRGIVKGTAIFGGVQVFTMIIAMLRGKFIAMLLGPAGMGVSALLVSTVNMINQVSSLGLNMGAVRDISMANASGDLTKLSYVVKIFRRLVFITGILGALISIIGSRWWSEIAFGTNEYTLAFIILGAMLLLTALASGEQAFLQGTRHLKNLAKTTLIGSFTGLLVGIPMFFFWGTRGIAPAMVALALVTYLSNKYFAGKINLIPVLISPKETFKYAGSIVPFGVALATGQLLGTLSIFFVNWFIRYTGSIADVGLYQATTSITTQYMGFVFSAMAVDYFPRLTAVSGENELVTRLVNQQAEIVMLVIAPLVLGLMSMAPLVVLVLLSEDFLVIVPVLRWVGFALFFVAAIFPLGYISFAKGDKKIFFLLDGVLSNIVMIVCAVIGYITWGFMGLGVAKLVSSGVMLVIMGVIVCWRYKFRFEMKYIQLFLVLFGCCLVAFVLSFIVTDYLQYGIISGVIFIVSGLYCFRELNTRIKIVELVKSKLGR